jgi:glycosyltransferase involved in cell wall biosynthesis
MKIIFFCSSLEPGRSGVGDHAMLLAKGCMFQGHECALVAFRDEFVKKMGYSHDLVDGLHVWRFSNVFENRDQRAALEAFVNSFEPNCMSIQFVPYSFDARGFVTSKFAEFFAKIKGRAKVQIMFHELWIGVESCGESLKRKVVGLAQRYLVKKFLQKLNPEVIHTSNRYYQNKLHQEGFTSCQLLPLFSNIQPQSYDADDWLFPFLNQKGIAISKESRTDYWLLGIFGSVYPEWSGKALVEKLEVLCKRHRKKAIILGVGNLGSNLEQWEEIRQGTNVSKIYVGRKSAREISLIFNSLDFGISTTRYSLLGKSASVASMLENGLPVIVTRLDQPATDFSHPGLLLLDDNFCEKFPVTRHFEAKWTLPQRVASFLNSISF